MELAAWSALAIAIIIVAVAAYFAAPTTTQQLNTTTVNAISSSTTMVYPNNQVIAVMSVQPSNLSVGAYLDFIVTLKNIGTSPIYYIPYCGGSSLSATIVPANFINVTQNICAQFCSGPIQIPQGMSFNVSNADCGGAGDITHQGNATANFTFRYGLNSTYSEREHFNFSWPLAFR